MLICTGTVCLIPLLERDLKPTGFSLSSQMGSPKIPKNIPLPQHWLTEKTLLDTLLGYEVLYVHFSHLFIYSFSRCLSPMTFKVLSRYFVSMLLYDISVASTLLFQFSNRTFFRNNLKK